MISSSFLAAIEKRLLDVCDRTSQLAEDLDEARLNWRPGEGKWSIAQCLEHTRLAADLYAAEMEPAIRGAIDRGLRSAHTGQPRHTIAGRLIIWAVDPDIKFTMKAPRDFRPAMETYPAAVVDDYQRSHRALAALTREADGLPLGKVRFPTPEVRFIRIHLADGFALLAMHAERHLNQAYAVRAAAGFP